MLHEFKIVGHRVKLWQRVGESYEHVLMKALGYGLYVDEYPNLEIETKVDLRYKPDLIAWNGGKDFPFWGECGANSLRKTAWILKHTYTKKLVLFKIGQNSEQLTKLLRDSVPGRYRPPGRLIVVNFVTEIVGLTVSKQIEKVSRDWYSEIVI
jgi:hypothetical protein